MHVLGGQPCVTVSLHVFLSLCWSFFNDSAATCEKHGRKVVPLLSAARTPPVYNQEHFVRRGDSGKTNVPS